MTTTTIDSWNNKLKLPQYFLKESCRCWDRNVWIVALGAMKIEGDYIKLRRQPISSDRVVMYGELQVATHLSHHTHTHTHTHTNNVHYEKVLSYKALAAITAAVLAWNSKKSDVNVSAVVHLTYFRLIWANQTHMQTPYVNKVTNIMREWPCFMTSISLQV
jgi:hypothetical protein